MATICLHKSKGRKLYLSTKTGKDLLEKIQEIMAGGLSIVFTRKALVEELSTWNSTNMCKSIVGIDASQLYPYSMYQPMPTGLYTKCEYASEIQRFTPRNNKMRSFQNVFLS